MSIAPPSTRRFLPCVVLVLAACAAPEAARAPEPAPAPVPAEPTADPKMATVCAELVRAVNAGDVRAYAALYAEDAVMTIHGTGIFSGRKAIEQHETELLRDFPGTRFTFSDVWLSGSTAVAHYA